MIVGGLQSGDIALTHAPGILQIHASPRKPLPPEPHHQKIRHEAGVAAVAVREGMNQHQPVMEAHRDLVGGYVLYSIHALVSSSNWRSATGIS